MKGNLQEAEVVGGGACEDVKCMGSDIGKLLLYFIDLDFLNSLCGSQYTVENPERDGNTRPPDLPLEKPICRSGSNS